MNTNFNKKIRARNASIHLCDNKEEFLEAFSKRIPRSGAGGDVTLLMAVEAGLLKGTNIIRDYCIVFDVITLIQSRQYTLRRATIEICKLNKYGLCAKSLENIYNKNRHFVNIIMKDFCISF